jgi:AcrR family transcriptional regulator
MPQLTQTTGLKTVRRLISRELSSQVTLMPHSPKPRRSAVKRSPDGRARWEERSTNRVLEAGRDQILERSRKIVAAAYQLLDEEGLEGLTIRAVLTKTGLSRRAFYERFADKDELVLAVFEETIRLATSHYTTLLEPVSDPVERLKLIVTSIGLGRNSSETGNADRSHRRGAAMSREHLRLAESRPEDLQAALRPLVALIAQQLADGIKAGLVRDADPERLATLVYNLIATTMHTEFLAQENAQPDQTRRAQLTNDIWEFCRRAVVR